MTTATETIQHYQSRIDAATESMQNLKVKSKATQSKGDRQFINHKIAMAKEDIRLLTEIRDSWVNKYPQTNPVLAQSPANINPIIMDGLSID